MVTTMRDRKVFLLAPGDDSGNPQEEQPTSSGSILVVEDDAPTLRLERVLLEEEGYEVEVVGSGEEAIEAVSSKKPVLVLLDIGLPGMDGFTTCQRIRELSEVPIIMVTGRDCLDDKVKGMNVGADDYVTKPFLTHELATRVKVLLRRSASEGGEPQRRENHKHNLLPKEAKPVAQQEVPAPEPPVPPEDEPVAQQEVPASEPPAPVADEPMAQQEAPASEPPAPVADEPMAQQEVSAPEAPAEPEDEPMAQQEVPAPEPPAPVADEPMAQQEVPAPEPPAPVADEPMAQQEVSAPEPPAPPEDPSSSGVYEGTVRLTVTALGPVRNLINFVSELRQNSKFRLLRLVANQHKEGMDIWLGLREPLPLLSNLTEIHGVNEVTASSEQTSEDEPMITVLLD